MIYSHYWDFSLYGINQSKADVEAMNVDEEGFENVVWLKMTNFRIQK